METRLDRLALELSFLQQNELPGLWHPYSLPVKSHRYVIKESHAASSV